MNRQEVFTKIVNHLRKQNAKSMAMIFPPEPSREDSYGCAYRGDGGLMCAVGCLITDEAYTDRMENSPAYSSFVIDILEKSGLGKIDMADGNFLRAMQKIHDDVPIDAWEDSFMRVANVWEVTLHRPENV